MSAASLPMPDANDEAKVREEAIAELQAAESPHDLFTLATKLLTAHKQALRVAADEIKAWREAWCAEQCGLLTLEQKLNMHDARCPKIIATDANPLLKSALSGECP